MLRLLWIIYLCFDQITKNMEYLHNTYFTHICGGKTWGREIINYPWGHCQFLSLKECRGKDAWWWYMGSRNTVPHLALSHTRTLWIRLQGGWVVSWNILAWWLKSDWSQIPNRSEIAWVSFDLQEHKSHNNAALVMDHLSLLWSNYQEYGIPNPIPILPTYVGGKREEEKLSMLPEDIVNFSP